MFFFRKKREKSKEQKGDTVSLLFSTVFKPVSIALLHADKGAAWTRRERYITS